MWCFKFQVCSMFLLIIRNCMSYVENWIYFSTCINFISHCSWQSILLARCVILSRLLFHFTFGVCCAFWASIPIFQFHVFEHNLCVFFFSFWLLHSFQILVILIWFIKLSQTQFNIAPFESTVFSIQTHWISYYMKYNKFTTRINLLKTPHTIYRVRTVIVRICSVWLFLLLFYRY